MTPRQPKPEPVVHYRRFGEAAPPMKLKEWLVTFHKPPTWHIYMFNVYQMREVRHERVTRPTATLCIVPSVQADKVLPAGWRYNVEARRRQQLDDAWDAALEHSDISGAGWTFTEGDLHQLDIDQDQDQDSFLAGTGRV